MDTLIFFLALMFFNYEDQFISDSILSYNYDIKRITIREVSNIHTGTTSRYYDDTAECQIRMSISGLNYSSNKDSIKFRIDQKVFNPEGYSVFKNADTSHSLKCLIVKNAESLNPAELFYVLDDGPDYKYYDKINPYDKWSTDLVIFNNDTLKIAYVKDSISLKFIENIGMPEYSEYYETSSGGGTGYDVREYFSDKFLLRNTDGTHFIDNVKTATKLKSSGYKEIMRVKVTKKESIKYALNGRKISCFEVGKNIYRPYILNGHIQMQTKKW